MTQQQQTPDRIRLTFMREEINDLKELQDLLGLSFFAITKQAIKAYKQQVTRGGVKNAQNQRQQITAE